MNVEGWRESKTLCCRLIKGLAIVNNIEGTRQPSFFCKQIFPDNFMRREVFALVVFCTFMEDGCNWKGEVRNLEVWSYLYVHSTGKMQNVEFTFVITLTTD